MEQKKFDINSLFGFVLIGGILLWMLYMNKPTEEEIQEKARMEAAAKENTAKENSSQDITLNNALQDTTAHASQSDSLAMVQMKNKLGSFSYSGTLSSATDISLKRA